jgi:5-methylthioadenosine/S-adenosylhomocysteine deaminase
MVMADIVIRDCTIVTMSKMGVIRQGLISVKVGTIKYGGRKIEAPMFEADEFIDGNGKIAMPGLINCHTHAPMSLFRGIAEDVELSEWLKEKIWPLEAKLRSDDVYYGALLSCVEMIKSGVTCFSDMYFYEDMVAKAAAEAGLRCILSSGIINAGHKMLGRILLREAVKVAKKYHGSLGGRITVMLGPHAVYSCSPSLLKKVGEEAEKLGVGVHIHLAESKSNYDNIKETYGKSEVEILCEAGLLKPNLLAAHCIHLSDEDIALMAKHNVKAVYNPISNMKLASGIPRIRDLLNAGIVVGLGTDGPASNNSLDMFDTMKAAALLQKAKYMDPRVLPARKVVEMATIDGAKAVGLESVIGSLEAGKKADIILIDAEKPHLKPLHDIYATLVYSARGSDVNTTIVDGRIVMDERKIKTLDEHEVIEKAEKAAYDLLSRKDVVRSLIEKFIKKVG